MTLLKYLIAIGLFLIFFSCNKTKKAKPNLDIPPKYVQKAEPVFKHQADLWFLAANTDTLKQIKIELADNDKEREQGLMFRRSMKPDEGMLFVFDEERRQSFWMRETHIPLDIIFVNANKEIVHIAKNCTPYSLESIPSMEYAKYVVEVNAGFCNKFDIKLGNIIVFAIK